MIRVLIADSHGVVRSGLKLLIEHARDMTVVGQAKDGREAVRLADELRPDIVVIDAAMPLLNGIDAAAQIVRANKAIGVIVLSMYTEHSYIVRALDAGAKSYLQKETADEEIDSAIRTVFAGRSFFTPRIRHALLQEDVREMRARHLQDSLHLLTDRERQILQVLAEGKSNKEVAALLDLSIHTVQTHRSNLMQKLGLHSIVELVLYAVNNAVISPVKPG